MATLLIIAQYIDSSNGQGKAGLGDVTVDIDSYDPASMTRSVVATGEAATESRNGRYHYWIQNADVSLLYAADFKTGNAGVSQKWLAAYMWDGAWAHAVELAEIQNLAECPPVPSVGFAECR